MEMIRRMDEMEMSINLKSVRITWVYGLSFLLVWSAYNVIRTGNLGLPFILLASQLVIYYFCRRMITRSLAGRYEE